MPSAELVVLIPGLRTVNVTNRREHWAVRARRVKAERGSVAMLVRTALRQYARGYFVPGTVTLTRISPRSLDSDGVVAALKAVRDQVAAELGIDDADPRAQWCYEQEHGAYAVRICLTAPEVA